MTSEVRRNRTLTSEVRLLLGIAEQLPNGRLELIPTPSGIVAMLMHDASFDGPTLVGTGDTAVVAVRDLVDGIRSYNRSARKSRP